MIDPSEMDQIAKSVIGVVLAISLVVVSLVAVIAFAIGFASGKS